MAREAINVVTIEASVDIEADFYCDQCRPFPEKKLIYKDIFHSEVNKLVISYCLRKWADDEDDKKEVRSKYDEKWLDMIEINIFIYI